MTETPEDHPKQSLLKRHSLLWHLIKCAMIGVALVAGIKLGWAKLVGWAKGVKPEYNFSESGATYSAGAVGGVIGGALGYENKSCKKESDPILDEIRSQYQSKIKGSFTQQVANEKAPQSPSIIVRS